MLLSGVIISIPADVGVIPVVGKFRDRGTVLKLCYGNV